MPKLLIFLLITLFLVAPLVVLLGFHDDCSRQACHMLMINFFILTSTIIVSTIFIITQLTSEVLLFETLYSTEVFLPPRLP